MESPTTAVRPGERRQAHRRQAKINACHQALSGEGSEMPVQRQRIASVALSIVAVEKAEAKAEQPAQDLRAMYGN